VSHVSDSLSKDEAEDRELRAEDRAGFKNASDRSSKLFDLRFLIGGLFTLYGVMIGVAGLMNSSADLKKSGGLRINLWSGLGMLVLGVVFLLWAYLRPVQHPAPTTEGDT
jgi:hypothetical protein